MRKYNKIKKTVENEQISEMICDICKKKYTFEKGQVTGDNVSDINEALMEVQEFHHIDFVGGYGSIFGDMNRVTADICQNCLKDKLGKYLEIKPSEGSMFY